MATKSTNLIDVQIGKRIRLRRIMIGMSQENLGDRLGLTFQQVQKYEKGTNRVAAARLQQIADILGVDVTYFFDAQHGQGSGPVEPWITAIGERLMPEETLQILQAFGAIEDPKLRKALLGMAQALAQVSPQASSTHQTKPLVS